MLNVRAAAERGHANHGWLDSYHTFSFADYFDPKYMGFRTLRVLNDDTVQPGEGFGTHGHKDMEIISYVVEGALEHRDSMGTGSVLRVGDVQRMSAGRGVTHSEFNHSRDEPLRFLQIWVRPEKTGIEPGYEEKHFGEEAKRDQLRLIASPDGRDDSLRIHQDVCVLASIVGKGSSIRYDIAPDRHVWVQVVRGHLAINGAALRQGDGAAVSEERFLELAGIDSAEILLFDLN